MAEHRIYSNQDIVNGLAVVNGGVSLGTPLQTYDGGNNVRTQHIPSGDSLSIFQSQATRYLYHGGPGGSGNWEH